MKKLKLLLFTLMLLIPCKVFGYGINNYYINATILDNGDLEVEEYFEMNGTYNGFERKINYKNLDAPLFYADARSYGGYNLHNGDGINIEEVRAVDIDNNFNFENIGGTKFKLVSGARKGDYGVYTVSNNYTNDGVDVGMFLPSRKNKAFYIKYKLVNMAILHNDVGELGWNIFSDELSESVNNLVAYINIPGNKEDVRVWAHGPLNGGSEIISKDKVKVSLSGLSSYTAIDARVTFDTSVIKNSNKKTNVNALDKIILYETDLAEQANEQRRQSDERNIRFIEDELYNLDQTPKRYYYDVALEYIEQLNDQQKKDEYYKRLYSYKDKIDSYEYGVFKSYISGDVNRINYNDAKEAVDSVFDVELKAKMNKELSMYYNKLRKQDIYDEAMLTLIGVITLLIFLFLYYKPIKFKKLVNPYYFRDIPSDLSPAAVGLLSDKKITKDEVSATILDLIRRKIISIEKKDNDTYDFILNNEYSTLSEMDKKLVLLIFPNKASKRINSKKIEKISHSKFKSFKNGLINELKDNKLIKDYVDESETIDGKLLTAGLTLALTPLFFIGLIFILIYSIKRYRNNAYLLLFRVINYILIITSIFLNSTVFHLSMLVSLIAIIVITVLLKRMPIKMKIKYTDLGKKEYIKWHGLRNFLIDFSKMEEKEIKEVSLWEKYLVYGVALGVGKKVLDEIKVKIQQQDINIDYTTLDNMMMASYMSSSINRLASSVVTNSIPTVDFPTSSGGFSSGGGSFSSGSGGGGGFSGGGGSFGGGGGGGRF